MKKIRWKAGAGAGVFTLSLLFVFAGTALAGTVPSGFAVEGFELAGMSREDAAAALEEAADAMEDCAVTLTLDGQEIETTAGDLGLFWENQEEVEEALDGVATCTFVSREEARDDYVEEYDEDDLYSDLDAEIFRHRYVIQLTDLTLMDQLQDELQQVDGIVKVRADEAISNGFITMRNIAGIISMALIAVLFLVSVFIIANTIKLTFFDRREEIAIMKMVGATDSFIRWPFVCEGFLMGVLAALIAFLLQWGLYSAITGGVSGSDIFAIIQIVPFSQIWGAVALTFVGAGVVIGVGGSVSAIRQYLKV